MPLSGEYEPSRNDRDRKQVELYEATNGIEGGTLNGKPVIILTFKGAKSGKIRKTPLMRIEHDGTYAVVASNGGAPTHPVWYRNIVANPLVELQDGAIKQEVRAREVFGEEKNEWWKRADAAWPDFPAYRARAGREIPVLVLEPLRRKTMAKKLEGKIAVITGGTEGIGLATAKLFVKEGAYVFITGRRQKELDDAVKAIGSNVYGVQGDVADLADLDRLYETISKVKGQIDIVFANAGVGEFVPFGAVTEEHFDKLFNINVMGTLFAVQKALPLLNDGSSIILNGSVASVKGTAAFGVYAASKAAIRSLVRTWSTDLKHRRIRSNVVSPGPINTPLASRQAPDVIARIVSTVPLGRMGEPDEVAKAALFLASDDSSFVTGIELFVDGGRAQI